MKNAIEVSGLSVSYDGNRVVDDVSFELPDLALAAVVGPNGAGKSTLLQAMLGLKRPDTGEVRLLGSPLKDVRKRIAYMPQRSDVDWTFPISVLEVVLLGTYPKLPLFKRPGREERDWARSRLELLDMLPYENRQIGELSGGQQQRVFIARALAQNADLLVLDEPFVGIDAASEEVILRVLQEQASEGRTVLAVHHDLAKVRDEFTHAVLINRHLVAYGEVAETLTSATIREAYEANLRFFTQLGAVEP